MSWALVINLSFCSIVCLHVLGYAVNRRRGMSGIEAVPFIEFWKVLHLLVKDGLAFVVSSGTEVKSKASVQVEDWMQKVSSIPRVWYCRN